MAETSALFRDMQRITRQLFITEISEDMDGTRIIAQDIGVRNFSGRFGRTELLFDRKGTLINEMAHI